jgi:hypothetical protein
MDLKISRLYPGLKGTLEPPNGMFWIYPGEAKSEYLRLPTGDPIRLIDFIKENRS